MRAILIGFFLLSSLAAQSEPRLLDDSRYEKGSLLIGPEDKELLQKGEIPDWAWITGGVVSFYGFGIGQAVQSRYMDQGWVFTVGELGSVFLFLSGFECDSGGFIKCRANGLATVGALGWLGFRIWGIVDAWVEPPRHNRRYRELKQRMQKKKSIQAYLAPNPQGAQVGFSYRF